MAKCILEELESRCDDCVDSVKAIDAPTPVQTTVPKIELRGDAKVCTSKSSLGGSVVSSVAMRISPIHLRQSTRPPRRSNPLECL
jgi:hypothetical protein